MSEVRMPMQKRSIEKRNKIIELGFSLMCNQGYFNTNTNDIAKYAGVSTGIVYQYFNDKKEIFIEGVKIYSDSIMFPIIDVLKKKKIDFDNMEDMLSEMLEVFTTKHTLSKRAHEEMMALSHLDDDVAKIFHDKEIMTTRMIVSTLNSYGIKQDNLFEKVHIIIGIVENYCHEIVYHHHDKVNYNVMKDEVIKIIISILKG